MTIQEIISRLSEGNLRFVRNHSNGNYRDKKRRKEVINGQKPFAIVLSCADSRVVPELIFDTGIGELFVVRVAGNIANQSSVASIEYAVAHCATKVIVVLAHQNCGAVTAAIKGGDNGKNLNHLLSHINTSIINSSAEISIDDVAKLNAKNSASELANKSEIIKDAIIKNNLKIIPAYYNLHSGKVDFTLE